MLLPGSRMQISFLKDMATFRDPQSSFTFLNYLHANNRLVSFTNTGTFYPLREEYNDYLSWCSAHFGRCVQYSEEVVVVVPEGQAPVESWSVVSRNTITGQESRFFARHVVVAVGGEANIPAEYRGRERVIHSSRYMRDIHSLLQDKDAPIRAAVIGGGQSAVEIYRDLQSRYPNSRTYLVLRQQTLRPADDSPLYVSPPLVLNGSIDKAESSTNEIFDPEQVDTFFSLPAASRKAEICRNLSTNYSVANLELIEALYSDMYRQRMHDPNEANWQHRILALRKVQVVRNDRETGKLEITLIKTRDNVIEQLTDIDVVVLGTGYVRQGHESLLKRIKPLLRDGENLNIDRNYRVQFREGAVSQDSGVWLQGCCELTHGVS
jgi:L-ornithine N5-monooxygenase